MANSARSTQVSRNRLFIRLTTAFSLVLLTTAMTAQAANRSDRRSVRVDGHGEVSVAPDRARLQMAAQVTSKELDAAQTQVNAIVRAYVKRAKALGASDADISTAGFNVQPQYDYSSKDGRKFVGYQVTRHIEVTVHDLAKVGDYLLQATAAGINNVSEPVLESSHADALRLRALAAAAKSAQARAQVLAQTLGAKLGPIHRIDASPASPQPVPMMRALAASAPNAAASGNEQMGFSAGEIRYRADIHAEFDLQSP